MASQDNDDDPSLFRKAVAGARPLKQDRRSPTTRRHKPVPKQRQRDEQEVLASLLSDEYLPDVTLSWAVSDAGGGVMGIRHAQVGFQQLGSLDSDPLIRDFPLMPASKIRTRSRWPSRSRQ